MRGAPETGRQVVALGFAGALSAVALDLLLDGRLGLFFDLCLISLCVGLALVAPLEEAFTVAMLPPAIVLGVFALLGTVSPGAVAEASDGAVQATVSGIAHHGVALGVGYFACLAGLVVRLGSARDPRRRSAAPPEPPPTSR